MLIDFLLKIIFNIKRLNFNIYFNVTFCTYRESTVHTDEIIWGLQCDYDDCLGGLGLRSLALTHIILWKKIKFSIGS